MGAVWVGAIVASNRVPRGIPRRKAWIQSLPLIIGGNSGRSRCHMAEESVSPAERARCRTLNSRREAWD